MWTCLENIAFIIIITSSYITLYLYVSRLFYFVSYVVSIVFPVNSQIAIRRK